MNARAVRHPPSLRGPGLPPPLRVRSGRAGRRPGQREGRLDWVISGRGDRETHHHHHAQSTSGCVRHKRRLGCHRRSPPNPRRRKMTVQPSKELEQVAHEAHAAWERGDDEWFKAHLSAHDPIMLGSDPEEQLIGADAVTESTTEELANRDQYAFKVTAPRIIDARESGDIGWTLTESRWEFEDGSYVPVRGLYGPASRGRRLEAHRRRRSTRDLQRTASTRITGRTASPRHCLAPAPSQASIKARWRRVVSEALIGSRSCWLRSPSGSRQRGQRCRPTEVSDIRVPRRTS